MKDRLSNGIVVAGLAIAGLAVVGCASLKSKIVGTWKIDPATVKSKMLDKLGSKPEVASAIKSGIESTRFEFKEDGTVTVSSTMGGNSVPGKWTLNGNEIVLTVTSPAAKEMPKLTVSGDGSHIHVAQGSGESAVDMDMVKA